MLNYKKVRTICFILLILWAIVIFVMSAQPAVQSSKLSGGIVKKIIAAFFTKFDNFSYEKQQHFTNLITFFVRKTAHFLEYFILGVISCVTALTYKQYKLYVKIITPIIFCVFYAVSDEVHQHFVPGRACRFFDMCIDSLGGIFAVVIITTIYYFKMKHRFGEVNEKKEIN